MNFSEFCDAMTAIEKDATVITEAQYDDLIANDATPRQVQIVMMFASSVDPDTYTYEQAKRIALST